MYLGRTSVSLFNCNAITSSIFLFQLLLPPENLPLNYRGVEILACGCIFRLRPALGMSFPLQNEIGLIHFAEGT